MYYNHCISMIKFQFEILLKGLDFEFLDLFRFDYKTVSGLLVNIIISKSVLILKC